MTGPVASEKGIDPNKLYSVQLRALQLVSMWPVKTTNPFIRFLAWSYFWFLTVLLMVSSVGLIIKAVHSENLVDRSEAMDIFTLTFSACYKMHFLVWAFSDLEQLVEMGQRFEHSTPSGWLDAAGFFSILHCTSAVSSLTLWGLCPFLEYLSGLVPLDKMVLPINVYFPFVVHPYVFFICYVLGTLALVSSTQIYMSIDAFFWTSLHLANGVLTQIATNLKEMSVTFPTIKGDHEENQAKVNFVKQNIRLHIEVLRFLKKLEHVFNSLILADVIHAIISLTFAIFQLTESHGVVQWCKMVFFVFICFLHQLLNSYFGQALIRKQEELYDTVNGIPWPDGPLQLQKMVPMMYTGMLRTIRMSAWKMYFLQYETFLEFVRAMISYFMVLRTLNEGA